MNEHACAASPSGAARWFAVLICALLAGCAGTQSRNTDPVSDPWEGFNRKMYAFNDALDEIARPIAVGYDRVMPDPLQRGVANFFRNLNYPVTVINQLLQGKFREGGISTARFLLNTTVGLLGFIDVATREGIPYYDEDFGQTLAVWGYDRSRYLVLPVFGPSTFRDGVGRGFSSYVHPVPWYAREEDNYWPVAVDLIQRRAALLSQDSQIEEAFDPYVFVRDAWMQNREYVIHDGSPPAPDYDSYLDFEEE